VNFKNIIRFANLLHAIEREFLMVPGEPSELCLFRILQYLLLCTFSKRGVTVVFLFDAISASSGSTKARE
jgi:hypothetical protein